MSDHTASDQVPHVRDEARPAGRGMSERRVIAHAIRLALPGIGLGWAMGLVLLAPDSQGLAGLGLAGIMVAAMCDALARLLRDVTPRPWSGLGVTTYSVLAVAAIVVLVGQFTQH